MDAEIIRVWEERRVANEVFLVQGEGSQVSPQLLRLSELGESMANDSLG